MNLSIINYLRGIGLSHKEGQILWHVANKEKLSVTEISNITGFPRSTTHTLVANLLEKRLLEETFVKEKRFVTARPKEIRIILNKERRDLRRRLKVVEEKLIKADNIIKQMEKKTLSSEWFEDSVN